MPQFINLFLLPLHGLPQLPYLRIILKVVGGKGILDAPGNLLNMPIVFRVRAGGGAQGVDGVHIVCIMLKHKIVSLGFIPNCA